MTYNILYPKIIHLKHIPIVTSVCNMCRDESCVTEDINDVTCLNCKKINEKKKNEGVYQRVYYCEKCDRFTDGHHYSDTTGDRVKAVCYYCHQEDQKECKVKVLEVKR